MEGVAYGRSTLRLYAISSMKDASSTAPLLWSRAAQRSAMRSRSSGLSCRRYRSQSSGEAQVDGRERAPPITCGAVGRARTGKPRGDQLGTAENLRGGRSSMSNLTTTLLVGTALVALLIGCSTSGEQDFGEMSDAALVDLLPERQDNDAPQTADSRPSTGAPDEGTGGGGSGGAGGDVGGSGSGGVGGSSGEGSSNGASDSGGSGDGGSMAHPAARPVDPTVRVAMVVPTQAVPAAAGVAVQAAMLATVVPVVSAAVRVKAAPTVRPTAVALAMALAVPMAHPAARPVDPKVMVATVVRTQAVPAAHPVVPTVMVATAVATARTVMVATATAVPTAMVTARTAMVATATAGPTAMATARTVMVATATAGPTATATARTVMVATATTTSGFELIARLKPGAARRNPLLRRLCSRGCRGASLARSVVGRKR